jgi:hypothetical protein
MTFLFYAAGQKSGSMTIRKLSEKLLEARRKNLPTGTIPLRPVPEGYYSEYIAEHAALLLDGGLARRRSPFVITPKGNEVLSQDISEIRQRNEQQANAWLAFLGINASR